MFQKHLNWRSTDTGSKRHNKLEGEGKAQTRKSKKKATLVLDEKETEPYNDEARKEKEIAVAVLAELGIDDSLQKPKETKRKAILENVPTESDVVTAKGKKKDKKKVKRSAAIEDAAQGTRSDVKERKTVSDDSDVFPPGSPVPDRESEESKSKAQKTKKATLSASDNITAAVEIVLAPDKGDNKSKKSKKRKHAESLLADNEATAPTLDVNAEGQLPRKKKKKGNSKIIDPRQDKSLSEQALKGMFVSTRLGLGEFILHYSPFLCLLPIRKSIRVEIQQSEAKLAHSPCLVTRYGSSGYKTDSMTAN